MRDGGTSSPHYSSSLLTPVEINSLGRGYDDNPVRGASLRGNCKSDKFSVSSGILREEDYLLYYSQPRAVERSRGGDKVAAVSSSTDNSDYNSDVIGDRRGYKKSDNFSDGGNCDSVCDKRLFTGRIINNILKI